VQARDPIDAADDQQFTSNKSHTPDGDRRRRLAIRARHSRPLLGSTGALTARVGEQASSMTRDAKKPPTYHTSAAFQWLLVV
jgi:hypothetical protein